jgi:lipopolysaccharide biosynthesis regulator YciM
VLDAIVSLEAANGDAALTARQWYARHLEKEPSLVAAAKWIAGEKLEHEQFHPQVQRALDHAVKPLTRYRCAACGFEAKRHFWQCPGCQAWDSYPARRVEEL